LESPCVRTQNNSTLEVSAHTPYYKGNIKNIISLLEEAARLIMAK